MYGHAVAVGLMVLCVVVPALVLVLQVRLAYRLPREVSSFLGVAGAAGVAAAASSYMYFAYFRDPTTLALAVGDVGMTLAPALLWMALLRLSARSRWWLMLALAGPTVVAFCSAAVPQPASLVVKVVFLAVYSALIVLVTSVPGVRRRPGVAVIRGASGIYAAYCVARLGVLLGVGVGADLYRVFFAIGPTTILSAANVIALTVGTILLARAVQRPPSLPAPSAGAVRLQVAISDRPLLRAAWGSGTVDALNRKLMSIVAEHAHIVEVERSGVVMAVPVDDVDAVVATIREEYGVAAASVTSVPINTLEVTERGHRDLSTAATPSADDPRE
ncbi:hypothetical protein [Microbacterium sp. P02]|uniref:hypothetical protein n=1 Tax=Microbacterium sp. P02 TaxID=3366260 RepID=UPI0036714AC4